MQNPERERERDKCFVAPISLQQRKHFIAMRALSDLASGGSANSNKAHTYHCGQYAELSICLIVCSFFIGNFCYCGKFLGCSFCFGWV